MDSNRQFNDNIILCSCHQGILDGVYVVHIPSPVLEQLTTSFACEIYENDSDEEFEQPICTLQCLKSTGFILTAVTVIVAIVVHLSAL